MELKDIFDIIWRKAKEKAINGDFNTKEEFRTYIYEHELPFVEAKKREGWTKENGKRVYIGPNGKKYRPLYLPMEDGNKFEHNDKRPTEKVYCGVRKRK